MRAATVVQQVCKSCRTCFKFYCMFYFTCDRPFSPAYKAGSLRTPRIPGTKPTYRPLPHKCETHITSVYPFYPSSSQYAPPPSTLPECRRLNASAGSRNTSIRDDACASWSIKEECTTSAVTNTFCEEAFLLTFDLTRFLTLYVHRMMR